MIDVDLKELKDNMENYARETNQEVWFFPEYEGVEGFSGMKDIIILGLNPSIGSIFPTKKDKLFYNLLKEKDLEYAHITDLIKVKAKNKYVTSLITNQDLMKKQTDFFSDELYIIKPKIIVTIGIQCNNLLKQYFPKINEKYKIIRIMHYGFNRFHESSKYKSTEDVFDKISKQLDEVKKEYNLLCKK